MVKSNDKSAAQGVNHKQFINKDGYFPVSAIRNQFSRKLIKLCVSTTDSWEKSAHAAPQRLDNSDFADPSPYGVDPR